MMVDSIWINALDRLTARLDETLSEHSVAFPNFADAQSGEWTRTADGDWTGGHFVGQLWIAAASRGNGYLESARAWSRRLRPRTDSPTIFRGFLFYYGGALGGKLVDDAEATEIGLLGARSLLKDFNASCGLIPLGVGAEEASDVGNGETSIDCVGPTVALLCWAARQTGEAYFREAGMAHALRHIDLCVRPDGSVCQSASVNPETGEVSRRYSHKGYSAESTWARAQAWAMLAFTQAHAALGDEPRLLVAARDVADWWLESVPDSTVPFWDFDAVTDPDAPIDTSAAAIATAALLKLSSLVEDSGSAARYRSAAEDTARHLVDRHLIPRNGAGAGRLVNGCYNTHLGLATDHELIWGDYYLYEALSVLSGELEALDV